MFINLRMNKDITRPIKILLLLLMVGLIIISCHQPVAPKVDTSSAMPISSIVNSSNTQRNGNFLNGSNLWVDQDWIYYIDVKRAESLYKMKVDGSQYFTLDNSPRLSYVFLLNGRVYYFEYFDLMNRNKDGSDPKEIKIQYKGQPVFLVSSNLIPTNDWIYFRGFPGRLESNDKSNLYKMKPDGSDVRLLYEGGIDNLNVTDDALYFTNSTNNVIMKCGLDGSKLTEVAKCFAQKMLVDGEKIYYLDEQNFMFMFDMKSKQKIQIGSDQLETYNIAGDWIYYTNKNNHDFLYQMSLDGRNRKQITEDSTGSILVYGDQIYYLNQTQGYKYYVMNRDGQKQHWIGANDIDAPVQEPANNGQSIALSEQYHTNNRISNGQMDVQDGWLYVCLPVDEAYDLVRMRFDGSKANMIKSYTYLSSLSIRRDSIFYRHSSDRDSAYNGTLNKLSIDGKNRQDVIDYPIVDYLIQGDWIFFSSDSRDQKLMKRNLKTGEQFFISPDVASDINMTNEWMYFASFREQNHLYKVRTNGKDRIKLLAEPVNTVMLHGDWIYYLNGKDEMFRIRTDGSGEEKVGNSQIYSYNLTSKWIYFIKKDIHRELYRINLDGSNPTKINSRLTYDLCVFGEQVFYIGYGENEYCVFRLNTDGSEEQIYPLLPSSP